ncbi:UDP-glycosyltransferase 89B1 [Triticum urartu]|uniref:UDP-glycosyltransferase 89B1 n=1 Tax=Triticum urartu TaxID=4572 RepID=M7Y7G7_TRIUA|nr:UDP-glycosyltransferase 89B1 [Triticum urartu]
MAAALVPHVLVVPFPAQGHMIPLLDLIGGPFDLSSGAPCEAITVGPPRGPWTSPHRRSYPVTGPLLARLLGGAIRAVTLLFLTHLAFPAGVESAKGCPPALMGTLIVAFTGLRGPLSSRVRARSFSPDRIVAILSGFFGWTQPLAAELGLPRITFSCCAVYGAAVLHSLLRQLPRREDENDDECPIPFPNLPSVPVYPRRQLSLMYRTYKEGDEHIPVARGTDMEVPLADMGFRRMCAVGPLAPEADATENHGGETAVTMANLCAWLDKFEDDKSVIYISASGAWLCCSQVMRRCCSQVMRRRWLLPWSGRVWRSCGQFVRL